MVPCHRRSADYCWYSGADVSQNEYLTMCGMLAGSMTDPPALAFLIIFIQPAVRRRSLTPLSIRSDVPAHYHTPITGGALLEYR